MTVLDVNNNNAPVPPNQNPQVQNVNGSPQFELQMSANDEQILCLGAYSANFASIMVQTTNPGDASVNVTTSDCQLLVTDADCACPDEYEFNKDATYSDCGPMPTNTEKLSLQGISGIKITAIMATTISITLSKEVVNGNCYANPGCCSTTNTILADILAEMKNDVDREIMWAEDVNNPGSYVRYVEEVNQETGNVTVSCLDPSGATVACPANLKPITSKEIKFAESCEEVVNAGSWGNVGEKLTKIICYDVTGALPVLMGAVWFNQTQNSDVTTTPPSQNDVKPCNDLPIETCGNANGVNLGGTQAGKTLEAIVLCDIAGDCESLDSSTAGFSFPYVYTDFFTAELELQAWLNANGGGTATIIFDGSVPSVTLEIENSIFVDGKWATDANGMQFTNNPSTGQDALVISLSDCAIEDLLDIQDAKKCCKQAEIEQLIHYDKEKVCTEITRKWEYDPETGVWAFSDFDHSDNPFVVTGDVYHNPKRFNLGGETLNFDDSAVVSPLAVPPGANLAEVAVWGGNVVYEKDQTMPNPTPTSGFHRVMDGGVFELEGRDEILAFAAIGQAGMVGKLEIRYKKGLKVND